MSQRSTISNYCPSTDVCLLKNESQTPWFHETANKCLKYESGMSTSSSIIDSCMWQVGPSDSEWNVGGKMLFVFLDVLYQTKIYNLNAIIIVIIILMVFPV